MSTQGNGPLSLLRDETSVIDSTQPNQQIKRLQSKGVDSVQARVQNLRELNPDINHETMCDALMHEFFKTYEDQCEVHRCPGELCDYYSCGSGRLD
jgi:lipoate-protein ligase A